MTDEREHQAAHEAHLGEFTEELRLLAEAVLERVEPALRRAADPTRSTEWGGCSWCPLCAAAALARGEHHDVVAALAGHGTAIVTVLREALAGVPVEPVMPEPGAPDEHPSPEPAGRESRSGAGGNASPSKPRYESIPVQIKG